MTVVEQLTPHDFDVARIYALTQLDFVPSNDQIAAAIARDHYLEDDLRRGEGWTSDAVSRLVRALQRNRAGLPLPRRLRKPSAVSNSWLDWSYDDGGRRAAGYLVPDVGDCVVRAIAIASQRSYAQVFGALDKAMAEVRFPPGKRPAKYGPTYGVPRFIYEPYLMEHLGWYWRPLLGIGQSERTRMQRRQLPWGRCVLAVRRHLIAVVKGTVHDTYDPSMGGTRCVYGIYTPFEWRP